MDEATMSLFPDNTLNTQAGDWRLIAIGDGPLGFDECGIVSAFSRPLGEKGIGLFYLSTFNSDYIMVNDQDFEQAVAILEETAAAAVAAAATVMSGSEDEEGPAATLSGTGSGAGRRKGSIQSIDTSVSSSSSPSHGPDDPSEASPVSTTLDEEEENNGDKE